MNATEIMTFNSVLTKVIDGLKIGIPISKTLKKLNYHSATFYSLCDKNTKRHFNEIKCLRSIDRTNRKYSSTRKDPFGNYNILEDETN